MSRLSSPIQEEEVEHQMSSSQEDSIAISDEYAAEPEEKTTASKSKNDFSS